MPTIELTDQEAAFIDRLRMRPDERNIAALTGSDTTKKLFRLQDHTAPA